ncbi:unnamed protein product [Mytilus coruscus]|uniref:Uncharacterized protein n=1 Tax=Mytilus coruscus TaxID=42192 RepID=A0A6J8CH00_MYTCO|nr:unnamed protein product [Mytilus coruscus]
MSDLKDGEVSLEDHNASGDLADELHVEQTTDIEEARGSQSYVQSDNNFTEKHKKKKKRHNNKNGNNSSHHRSSQERKKQDSSFFKDMELILDNNFNRFTSLKVKEIIFNTMPVPGGADLAARFEEMKNHLNNMRNQQHADMVDETLKHVRALASMHELISACVLLACLEVLVDCALKLGHNGTEYYIKVLQACQHYEDNPDDLSIN